MAKLQPAVKKETRNVALCTGVGTAVMILVFFILHLFLADKVPFDYTVILGGIGGAAIAILNFFLMALTVQTVASQEDQDKAKKLMKVSYTRRLLLQIAWIIAVCVAPCFQLVAGILPLLFPGAGIKILGLIKHN